MNTTAEMINTVWRMIQYTIYHSLDIRAAHNYAIGATLMSLSQGITTPNYIAFRLINADDITDPNQDMAKVRVTAIYGETEFASKVEFEFVIRFDQLLQFYINPLKNCMSDFSLQRNDENEGQPRRISNFIGSPADVMKFEFGHGTGPMGLWLSNNGLSKLWYTVYRPEL